jgi:hypothetical protein
MESVTDATKHVVVIQLNSAFGDVTVELSVLSRLCHSPAAAIDVINFQQTYFVTPTIGATPSA